MDEGVVQGLQALCPEPLGRDNTKARSEALVQASWVALTVDSAVSGGGPYAPGGTLL